MSDLATAVALVFVIEGVAYALFPDAAKKMMAMAIEQPSSTLRKFGLMAAVLGVGLVWLIRG